MLLALVALSALTLLAVLFLLLRAPAPPAPAPATDPRLLELSGTLPTQLTRLEAATEARFAALDHHLRQTVAALQTDLSTHRRDAAADAQLHREQSLGAARDLREEITRIVTHLGGTLHNGLADFRTHSTDGLSAHRADTREAAETLRHAVKQDLDAIGQRLAHFISETSRHQTDARDALHNRLTSLGEAQTTHHDKLRSTVEDRLLNLSSTNAAKLEEMRLTVDEKLHSTLHTRLTESFGQVTGQLERVHAGLGEMSKLSEGVDDLSRIFTNVKSRGGFAEVQLGMLLAQMLAPSQFVKNARVKRNTQECVEFAVRFPGHTGEVLLPIDAKFPREDWERLEAAYTSNRPEEILAAGKSFETAIRTEAKRICEKYINEPVTTPYAIMFLPTEGLYAEVMRRDTLQAELQSKCKVTIAGPNTLAAILTSFQMGFHMLALQKKGGEVWNVLKSAKTEFGKFELLMDKMEGDVNKIHKTIGDVGVRTRAINRTLREVGETDAPSPTGNLLSFDEAHTGIAPLLAAAGDRD